MTCSQCGSTKSYAWRYRNGAHTCGDCAHISIRHTPLSVQKQRNDNAKDIIQPYKMTKRGVEENRDFTRVYGKSAIAKFDQARTDAAKVEMKKAERIADIPNALIL